MTLVVEQKFYGCIQLTDCLSNFPKQNTPIEVYVGNNNINIVYQEVTENLKIYNFQIKKC